MTNSGSGEVVCTGCVKAVTKALAGLPGIDTAVGIGPEQKKAGVSDDAEAIALSNGVVEAGREPQVA